MASYDESYFARHRHRLCPCLQHASPPSLISTMSQLQCCHRQERRTQRALLKSQTNTYTCKHPAEICLHRHRSSALDARVNCRVVLRPMHETLVLPGPHTHTHPSARTLRGVACDSPELLHIRCCRWIIPIADSYRHLALLPAYNTSRPLDCCNPTPDTHTSIHLSVGDLFSPFLPKLS